MIPLGQTPAMKLNLDTVRTEIDEYLKSSGFVVFYGFARSDDAKAVDWDTENHPDYKKFVECAKQLDVKLVVLHQRSFDATVIDRAIEEMEGSDVEFDERRSLEARLRELSKYDGFTCALELSFDYQDTLYLFEVHADWYEELSELMEQFDFGMDLDEDEEEEDESFGGYYSRN